MNDLTRSEQLAYIKCLVKQHRMHHASEEGRWAFIEFVSRQGWKVHEHFEAFVELFYGASEIKVKGIDTVILLWPGLYEYTSTSRVWKDTYGEDILPVGSSGLTRLYLSESGGLYGDIRDVSVIQFYGSDFYDGMFNFLTGRHISSLLFEYDEETYDCDHME